MAFLSPVRRNYLVAFTVTVQGFFIVEVVMSEKEIWKDVVGFEGWYQVSSFGAVKRMRDYRGTWAGRCLSPYIANTGYNKLSLSKNSKTTQVTIHRLVASAFIPNPENKPQVNHKDGIKSNDYASNLEWVTRSENMRHSVDVLGNMAGERNFASKLKNEQVWQIKQLLHEGISQRTIAKRFNVAQRAICRINQDIGYIEACSGWNKQLGLQSRREDGRQI